MHCDQLITAYGAVADDAIINTSAIQAAIDECARTGGRVVVPPGTYLTGSLQLKSGVELHLAHGAVLKGSPRILDYTDLGAPFRVPIAITYAWKSLIWALDAKDIALTGTGTVDGNGTAPDFHVSGRATWEQVENRPCVLYFIRCTDVLIADVTLRDSAFWMQHHTDCRRMRFHRVKVFNFQSHNNDGLDLDNCADVVISDCHIECSDDALCLKSMTPGINERITVTNCVLRSHYNAFKLGTETAGGLRDFTMSNCVLCGPVDVPHPMEHNGRTRGFAGIALMSIDGAVLENIAISNLSIHHMTTAFFIRLQQRGTRYWPEAPAVVPPGRIRGISISNVVARDLTAVASSITGLPGHPVEDVNISDVVLELPGGGTREDAERPVPEKRGDYPDCTMFGGNLPASVIYLRHVDGIALRNWRVRIAAPGDYRPAFASEDATQVEVSDCSCRNPHPAPAVESSPWRIAPC